MTREDLFSPADYERVREDFRARVLEHQRSRQVPVGPSATLHFEDALTVLYRVQEWLRLGRIVEADQVERALAAGNSRIPDGSNWKATLRLHFPDPVARHDALARLKGIEGRVFVRVEGFDPVFAFTDEALGWQARTETSSAHPLRFDLSVEMVGAVRSGARVSLGIDHPSYAHVLSALPDALRCALVAELR